MAFIGTFIPGGRFAFPRSFCASIAVRCDPPGASFASNILEFWIAGSPAALCKVTFEPDFFAWTSNRWTLDHVVLDGTYEYPPNPTVFNLPFYISWKLLTDEFRTGIEIDTSYGANYVQIDLPGQPGGYWLPPPYPS